MEVKMLETLYVVASPLWEIPVRGRHQTFQQIDNVYPFTSGSYYMQHERRQKVLTNRILFCKNFLDTTINFNINSVRNLKEPGAFCVHQSIWFPFHVQPRLNLAICNMMREKHHRVRN